uniref:hypothetical protein n=1 Tax=Trichocoleus desertorum TaxID=1481672 RepID=UPI0025B4850C|nr:hypothetical protein [Trichocoleus desertorum]
MAPSVMQPFLGDGLEWALSLSGDRRKVFLFWSITMNQVAWFLVAWVGGSLVILGSLMTLGSLLLWLVPRPGSRASKTAEERSRGGLDWQNRVKLMAVSVGLAIAGFTLLVIFPLPCH